MKGQEEKEVSFLRRRYLEITLSILFVGLVFVFAFTIENYFYLVLAIGVTFFVFIAIYGATIRMSKKKTMGVGRLEKKVRDPSHEFLAKISTVKREKKAPGSPTAVTTPGSRSGGGTTSASWGLHHIDVWVPLSDEIKATKDYNKFTKLIEKTEKSSIAKTLDILKNEIQISQGDEVEYYIDDSGLNISFGFKKGSNYTFIIGAIIQIINEQTIMFDGILSSRQDFSFSLKTIQAQDKIDYVYTSSFVLKWEDLISNKVITEKLDILNNSLNQLIIDRKIISGIITAPKDLSLFLEFLKEVYNELRTLQSKVTVVNKILCYQCNEELDTESDRCHNCGSIKPECSVCRLDLYPSEKDEAVQTPCCGVYAHKSHMVMWLKENEKCPNCHKKQITWLKQLIEPS